MTRTELETFVERYMAVFRRRDAVASAQFHTPDGVVESPMFSTLRGRKAIEDARRAFFAAFPDLELTVDAVLLDPPRVAIFTTFQATHVGEFFGLPGTNKRLQLTMAILMTVEDSLVTHSRWIYDFTGLLVQAGVLRAKPAKP